MTRRSRRATSTEHLVADRVAEVVVDQLEVVEVDEEHGAAGAAVRSAFAIAVARCSWNSARLGRSVSGVVEGQVRQPLLGQLARGHVEDRAVEELHLAGCVEDRRCPCPCTHRVVPSACTSRYSITNASRRSSASPTAVLDHLAVVGMDHAREGADAVADELGRRVARDRLDLVAQEPHRPVALGRAAVDRAGHVRDQRLEAVRVPHAVVGEVGGVHPPGVRPEVGRAQHPERGSPRTGPCSRPRRAERVADAAHRMDQRRAVLGRSSCAGS